LHNRKIARFQGQIETALKNFRADPELRFKALFVGLHIQSHLTAAGIRKREGFRPGHLLFVPTNLVFLHLKTVHDLLHRPLKSLFLALKDAFYRTRRNIRVRSMRAGEGVMAGVSRFLEKKLKVNRAKSAVAAPSERKFLGFTFTFKGEPRRCIAPQSLQHFKVRVRELLRTGRHLAPAHLVKRLKLHLSGWRSYFGFCETPSVLRRLDSWLGRRLRLGFWRQWRRGRMRYAELRQRGVNHDLAARTAGSAHGPWRLSRSPALSFALPNTYFTLVGLPTLAPGR
jgi:hypothetical protein